MHLYIHTYIHVLCVAKGGEVPPARRQAARRPYGRGAADQPATGNNITVFIITIIIGVFISKHIAIIVAVIIVGEMKGDEGFGSPRRGRPAEQIKWDESCCLYKRKRRT